MLDEYQQIQPIVYKMLKNAVSKDKYSHAYLFETNGFYDSFNFIYSFVKTIMCSKKYTNKLNCGDCKQCEVIESSNFPEIEVIEPDGLWIKKEQLQKIQNDFNKKAIIGNKKIYIIKEAEKLNKQAANSILKFLEEPVEGVVAILITENIYQLLETIRSRCQIISLKEEKQQVSVEDTLTKLFLILQGNIEVEEEQIIKLEKAINFINYFEKNKIDTIIYTGKLWHDYIKAKEDFALAFDTMILYYKDILNYLSNRPLEIFEDYKNEIENIANHNEISTISFKLNIITKLKEKIKYNANTNLIMDKLIIELEGGN